VKTAELIEQKQVRRSPEERAKDKEAPDYWRKELRKEFNGIVNKFGGTIKPETFSKYNTGVAHIGGDLIVRASGPSTLLSTDRRATGLLKALSRWAHGLVQSGHQVTALRDNGLRKEVFEPSDSAEAVHTKVVDGVIGWDNHLKWWRQQSDLERRPVKVNLIFLVKQPDKYPDLAGAV